MKTIEVNETPVRTSKNFNINCINVDDIIFNEKVAEFENVSIEKNNSDIDDVFSPVDLKYGIGSIAQNNINNNFNNCINIKTAKNDVIKIDYTFDDDNLNLINKVNIDAQNSCDIYIKLISETDDECFHNGVIKLFAHKNVKVNVYLINLLNDKSNHIEAIENELDENSIVNYTIIDFGSKLSVSNYYTNIVGNNASNDLKTIYIGTDKDKKDLNYIVHLNGEKTNIDIDVQGALKDEASKNFKGTIDFKKGCKKAIGNENEYCVLLSDKAKSIALPMLLCTEEDVEGNHSTASGTVDKQKLFYMMSRGISYNEAVKLIIRANFNKIIERIKDKDIKNTVIEVLDKKI